ncbi:MAG: hypothetical protein CMH64_02700 [Nanoarchaeota archaeon]|nr:hypothetical protein [Nanoarchaeota archaeon]|tara:strand:- start:8130 stop:8954 length:825 start_codon:yes stop_codon:yes gene_type:complete
MIKIRSFKKPHLEALTFLVEEFVIRDGNPIGMDAVRKYREMCPRDARSDKAIKVKMRKMHGELKNGDSKVPPKRKSHHKKSVSYQNSGLNLKEYDEKHLIGPLRKRMDFALTELRSQADLLRNYDAYAMENGRFEGVYAALKEVEVDEIQRREIVESISGKTFVDVKGIDILAMQNFREGRTSLILPIHFNEIEEALKEKELRACLYTVVGVVLPGFGVNGSEPDDYNGLTRCDFEGDFSYSETEKSLLEKVNERHNSVEKVSLIDYFSFLNTE